MKKIYKRVFRIEFTVKAMGRNRPVRSLAVCRNCPASCGGEQVYIFLFAVVIICAVY